MRKQTEIIAQTKKKLTDAFWSLYCDKNIERITIKEITDKAGYNRGTFYVYFIDVYDVLDQIESSLLPDDVEDEISLDLNHLDPMDLIKRFTEMYNNKSDYLSVLLGENGDPHFVPKMKKNIKPIFNKRFSIKDDDIKFDYIFEYFFSSMIAVLSLWFQNDKNIPINDLLNLLHSLVTEGTLKQFQKNLCESAS